MFSACRPAPTQRGLAIPRATGPLRMKLHRHVPRIALALAMGLAVGLGAGCSKSPGPAEHTQDAPLVTAPAAPASEPRTQALKSELTTAGTHVSYEARFR